jgi:hypothetical protein
MLFGLYALGFAIVIGGLIYGAYLLHMPGDWIAVGAIVLLGVGILTGVKALRQKIRRGKSGAIAAVFFSSEAMDKCAKCFRSPSFSWLILVIGRSVHTAEKTAAHSPGKLAARPPQPALQRLFGDPQHLRGFASAVFADLA